MKIKKKSITFIMTMVLICSMISGCTKNTTSSDSTANENTLDFSNTTLNGTVTSVDNNKITLSLTGGMGGGHMMDGGKPDGNPSEQASDGNNEAASSEQPAEEPNGQTPPEQPADDSSNPAASEENASKRQENQTSFTLTITDESVLQDIALSDITEGSLLSITFGNSNTITSITLSESFNMKDGDTPSGTAPEESSVNTGSGATTITEDTQESNISYSSENEDENALRVEGLVNYSGTSLTIKKSSGDTSNTESSDFYGLNAGFLSLEGAASTITDSTITTDAKGSNGIFAYGSGTNVTVSNTSITTSADNSGGIDVTGGAAIQASNLNIETNGNSSAAIRSDRGGGTIHVSQGTYTTNGTGSPAVYSTADITVSDAVLTANASEGVVIEGKNSVTLENCDVSGNMQGTYQGDENENLHTIMIYQSMSGDADEGEGSLTVNGGSITGFNGDLIYSTNTTSVLTLNNVALTLANDTLLRVAGNDSSRGWGDAGSNGARMSLFTTDQKLTGKIIVDEISSLSITMSEESSFEGSINEEQEGGTVSVSLDDDSTWKLTADSYITSFEGSLDNIDTNGYTLYIDGVAQSI